jgi:hypothetical protein
MKEFSFSICRRHISHSVIICYLLLARYSNIYLIGNPEGRTFTRFFLIFSQQNFCEKSNFLGKYQIFGETSVLKKKSFWENTDFLGKNPIFLEEIRFFWEKIRFFNKKNWENIGFLITR